MNHRPLGRRPFFALLAAAALAPAACSKPEPPKITPKAVKVLSISNTGIQVEVTLAVENPNGIDLDARSVDAGLTLDGGLEVGRASIPKGLHLPARQTVDLQVPVTLAWKNVAALGPYALRDSVPYTVDGRVQFGSPLSVGVPFSIKGLLTRADLAKLAISAIPGLPGLK